MEDEVSGALNDWEAVQSSKEWSMVVIRDSLPHDFSVFPPINHEGLHISSPHNRQSQQTPSPPSPLSSSSSSSPSVETGGDPTPSSQSDSRIRLPGNVSGWLGVGLEVLRSRVFRIVSSFRYNAAIGRAVLSFTSVAGVVTAMLLSLLYMRIGRRHRYRHQRYLKENEDHLKLLIKERDEKIIQLLHQIAQMNEVLLARCRVPVIRMGE